MDLKPEVTTNACTESHAETDLHCGYVHTLGVGLTLRWGHCPCDFGLANTDFLFVNSDFEFLKLLGDFE